MIICVNQFCWLMLEWQLVNWDMLGALAPESVRCTTGLDTRFIIWLVLNFFEFFTNIDRKYVYHVTKFQAKNRSTVQDTKRQIWLWYIRILQCRFEFGTVRGLICLFCWQSCSLNLDFKSFLMINVYYFYIIISFFLRLWLLDALFSALVHLEGASAPYIPPPPVKKPFQCQKNLV